jgi:hypothetical protein
MRSVRLASVVLGVALVTSCFSARAASPPLALHPQNPHYFVYRGRPTVIITSGEHYGAVLNLDFDYLRYLKTLEQDGLNGTRTWAGAYCEHPAAFNIRSNTLAPLPGRFICPWARSPEPGYANGGNKFDLNRWDPGYFKRLKDFLAQARKRGVIVELNLFCPFYEDGMWQLSPMNIRNNINGVGAVARTNVYTLDRSGALLAAQEAMVRKLVTELRPFDNLYFEICNEPYFGGVTLEWQRHIADVIWETEAKLGVHHLVSQNIANGKSRVKDPHPAVSILNFHYAAPPDTVALNFELNRVIGDNETGFRGTNDAPYRMEAWDFLAAGGGLFNHLDYSFVVGRENGTFVYPAAQPGGGNPVLRRQFGILSRVFNDLDFIHLRPASELVKAELPPGATVRALANPGREYLIYVRTALGDKRADAATKQAFGDNELALAVTLPSGAFRAEWIDTKTGKSIRVEKFISEARAAKSLSVPAFEQDIALVIRKAPARG